MLLAAALSIAGELVALGTVSLPESRRLPATLHLVEKSAVAAGREIGAQVLLVKVESRSIALRGLLVLANDLQQRLASELTKPKGTSCLSRTMPR